MTSPGARTRSTLPASTTPETPVGSRILAVGFVAISLVLAIGLAGCGGDGGSPVSGASEPKKPVSAAAPQGPAVGSGACGKPKARQAFGSFLRAFNGGDYETLNSLFAAQPAFAWFSSNDPGTRLRKGAERRDTLVPYFRWRHSEHDRLRAAHLTVNTGARHSTGLGFELRRSAADFRHGRWLAVSGKASLTCHGRGPKFLAVSLGGAHDSAG